MGFLDDIFETKARRKKTAIEKPLSTEAVGRATAGGGNHWAGFGSAASKWDIERAVSHAYDRVIWVFRCVDAIASNQATVPMYLKKFDSEAGQKVEDKQLSKLLNFRTNPYEDAWAFRYRLSSQLLLSTKGAFIELVRSGSGEVVEMYLLDPGSVEPIKDSKTWVSGYKVSRANGASETLSPQQVLWVRAKRHPLDVYAAVTPIIPATLSIETDHFARIFNRNFLRNDGRPGMLIGINGDMSSEDAQELKDLFSGGYARAGETRVIEADGISVNDLSARPRDVQWAEAITSAKEEILLAFGVPESVLGNASGRCLRASENVFLASGEVKRAEELVGQQFFLLQPTYDNDFIKISAVAEYAEKEEIYKITTFSGRTLETNAKHPLYMAASAAKGPFKRDIFPKGWTPMEKIKDHFDKNDSNNFDYFTEVAVPVAFDQHDALIFDYDSCFEDGADGKHVPDYLFTADVEAQRAFISGLYSEHGLVSQHTALDIYAPSREFAVRLQRLLQRIGVHASVGTKKLKHLVSIGGKINMFNFLSQLELVGDNKEKASTVWERLSTETSREHNAFRSDTLPPGLIWDRVYSIEKIGEDQTVALTVEGDHSYMSLFWEHNTYNNADSEEETFWTKTMVPHCDAIARALEPLTDDANDDLYLAYDYESVDVLQRAQRRREDTIKQDFARGIATLNDVLETTGQKKLDAPYARVYFHPSRLIGGVDLADVEAVRMLPVIGATLDSGPGFNNPFGNTSATGGDGVVGGSNDLIQGELAGNGAIGAQQTINDQAARTNRSAATLGIGDTSANPNAIVDVTERINRLLNRKSEDIQYEIKQIDTNTDTHKDFRLKMQGFIEGSLESWSNRQLEVVKERVNHVKVRKGTRHWDYPKPGDQVEAGELLAGTKVLDTSYIVDANEWINDAKFILGSKVSAMLFDESQSLVNSLKDAGYISNANVYEIVNGVMEQVTKAITNQTNLLSKHISVMDTSGKSINEIQDTITSEAFDRSRWTVNLAKMISTNAIERLYDALYSGIDGKVYKIWCSGTNEHYRDGHGDLHGTKKSIADTFKVNESELKYPTDGFNSEAIACDCWLYYGIDG